ncbi:MAG: pyridoxamine 5'-phosphate oxidase [Actinobacteria bacterium]|nr:MAG: pyridoxamine 5'-phosphate oxidase [Actinomycetota bacterium]
MRPQFLRSPRDRQPAPRILEAEELALDPLVQFRAWFAEAEAACPCAGAMTLATVGSDGSPSARIVLLRALDERGFVFFSNRASRKGRELTTNPRAALVFHWWELGRQVRVEGLVEEVEQADSDAYWRARPRPSRIAAWASPQSRPIASRRVLDDLYAEAEAQFGDGDVPLPPFWGGYRVLPETVELWLHRDNRLHDRLRYTRDDVGWRGERLAP